MLTLSTITKFVKYVQNCQIRPNLWKEERIDKSSQTVELGPKARMIMKTIDTQQVQLAIFVMSYQIVWMNP